MQEDVRRDVENLSTMLAVLVAGENEYTYIDKIGYAPSKDLLMFYLKEALRDFHSLVRGRLKNERARELLNNFIEKLKSSNIDLNKSIDKIYENITDRRSLREISSLISAKALAISAKYVERREGGV